MLFFRNILGLIIIAPWVLKRWPKSLKVQNWKVILLRSVMGLLNLFFIFLAVQRISLINTTLLNNSAPFFVPFILWFWLAIPLNHKLWPAIVIGFIGIALILQPDKKILNMGAIYGLLSGICLATNIITIRMMARKESFVTYLLYFFVVGFVLSAPFALLNWRIDDALTLIGLISLGFFSMAGQFFLFYALKQAKASHLSPFCYATVIFSGIYEWLIWGMTPKPIALFGTVLIIAAGVWIFLISKTPKELSK